MDAAVPPPAGKGREVALIEQARVARHPGEPWVALDIRIRHTDIAGYGQRRAVEIRRMCGSEQQYPFVPLEPGRKDLTGRRIRVINAGNGGTAR
jgi:hypothetical protein